MPNGDEAGDFSDANDPGGEGFGSFGGGAGTAAGTLQAGGPAPLLSSEDVLRRGRELALRGVPLQVSNLLDALAQLRARSAGSTAEIFPSIINQLSQLRSQYAGASQAIARRLGFAGGGQTRREQGGILAQATGGLGGLITGEQQTAYANLLNTLAGLQPALSGGARAPLVQTTRAPINLELQGAGIASLISTARKLQSRGLPPPPTPSPLERGGLPPPPTPSPVLFPDVTTTGLGRSGIRPENIFT